MGWLLRVKMWKSVNKYPPHLIEYQTVGFMTNWVWIPSLRTARQLKMNSFISKNGPVNPVFIILLLNVYNQQYSLINLLWSCYFSGINCLQRQSISAQTAQLSSLLIYVRTILIYLIYRWILILIYKFCKRLSQGSRYVTVYAWYAMRDITVLSVLCLQCIWRNNLK